MKRLNLWSGMLLIFVTGVVIGVLTSMAVIKHHFRGFVRGGPARASHHIAMELVRGIDLSEEQRSAIDRILDEEDPWFEKRSREFFEEMKARTDKQLSRIRDVLDDGQKAEFDRNRSELEERMKRFRKDRNPGRHGLQGDERDEPPPEPGPDGRGGD